MLSCPVLILSERVPKQLLQALFQKERLHYYADSIGEAVACIMAMKIHLYESKVARE